MMESNMRKKDKLLRQKEETWNEIIDDLKHDAREEYQDFIHMVRDQGDYALAQLKESTVFSFVELKYQELEKIEQGLMRIESGINSVSVSSNVS